MCCERLDLFVFVGDESSNNVNESDFSMARRVASCVWSWSWSYVHKTSPSIKADWLSNWLNKRFVCLPAHVGFLSEQQSKVKHLLFTGCAGGGSSHLIRMMKAVSNNIVIMTEVD